MDRAIGQQWNLRKGSSEMSSYTQCKFFNKRTGNQCGLKAFDGAKYCEKHQAAYERHIERKQNEADNVALGVIVPVQNEALNAAGLIQHDDAEANGAYALMMEIRRTVARIRYCDRKIEELALEDPSGNNLIWGTTKVENKDGFEKGERVSLGTVTKESAISQWVLLQRFEREHLLKCSKMWIDAGFEQRKLDLQVQTIDGLNRVIKNVVEGLGRSVAEEQVRRLVQRALSELVAGDRPVVRDIRPTPVF